MMGHLPIIPKMATGDLDGPRWPSLFGLLAAAGLMRWARLPQTHFQLRALPQIIAQQSWHALFRWKFDAPRTIVLDSTSARSQDESLITKKRKIRSRSRDQSLPREEGSTLKDQGEQLKWQTRSQLVQEHQQTALPSKAKEDGA